MNMNLDLKRIEEIIRSKPQTVYYTSCLLEDYFKLEGHNPFKASEEAETRRLEFIKIIQDTINKYYQDNICCLFDNVNSYTTKVNLDYFKVLQIKQELHDLTWQEFEDFCGVLIQKCFSAINVTVTQRSGDGGVDFFGDIPFKATHSTTPFAFIKLFGQAKKYAPENNVDRVGVDLFQAFAHWEKDHISYPAQLFLFCTTSDFTTSAQERIKKYSFIGMNGLQLATLVYSAMKDTICDPDNIFKQFMEK